MNNLFGRLLCPLKKLPIFSFRKNEEDSELILMPMDQIKSKLKGEIRPLLSGMVVFGRKLLYENKKTGLVIYQVNTCLNSYRSFGDFTSWGRYLVGDLNGFTYSDSWINFERYVYFKGVTEEKKQVVIHHKGIESIPDSYKVVMMRDVILDKAKFSAYKKSPGPHLVDVNTHAELEIN